MPRNESYPRGIELEKIGLPKYEGKQTKFRGLAQFLKQLKVNSILKSVRFKKRQL